MRILPAEYYDDLTRKISAVRAAYPTSRMDLHASAAAINCWTEMKSRALLDGDLVDGRRYGYFGCSDTAAAYIQNTRRWVSDHGDLYVTVWTWNEQYQRFFCENAWGQIHELNPAIIKRPLIELPEE